MTNDEIAALVKLAEDEIADPYPLSCVTKLAEGIRALAADNKRFRDALLGKDKAVCSAVMDAVCDKVRADYHDGPTIDNDLPEHVLGAAARALGVDDTEEVLT